MFRYIGNKTKLLPAIMQATEDAIGNAGTVVDLMAGTGSVALEYRRKGYGTELVAQSLNYEISHKRNNFMLTASDLGLIIYKKLGFTPMDTFYEYNLL